MHNTVIQIIHKITNQQIISTNPTQIPRKGDRIMMGVKYDYNPMVEQVVWQYESAQTNIFVYVS